MKKTFIKSKVFLGEILTGFPNMFFVGTVCNSNSYNCDGN